MKLRKVLALGLAALMTLSTLTSCGGGGTAPTPTSSSNPAAPSEDYVYPEMEIGVASIFGDPASASNFNAEGMSQQRFADLVEEKSGGKITIKNYWSGVLQGDYLSMLADGDVDMYYGYMNASLDKRFSAFNLPGLITDVDMAADLFGTDGEFFVRYKEIAAEYGIVAMTGTSGTMRQLYNSKHEVRVPSDVSDLLVRSYSDATVEAYWNGLCNTVTLPMSEVYTSLQLGSIDGCEHGAASGINNNLHDVTSYFTVCNWQWQYMPSFFASQYLYDELDAEVIALLEECAEEASGYYTELFNEMAEEAYTFLEENGVAVYFPTEEEQQEWNEYGLSLYDELKETYGCPELIDELVAIADEYKSTH